MRLSSQMVALLLTTLPLKELHLNRCWKIDDRALHPLLYDIRTEVPFTSVYKAFEEPFEEQGATEGDGVESTTTPELPLTSASITPSTDALRPLLQLSLIHI